jgi:hypothetical protein
VAETPYVAASASETLSGIFQARSPSIFGVDAAVDDAGDTIAYAPVAFGLGSDRGYGAGVVAAYDAAGLA